MSARNDITEDLLKRLNCTMDCALFNSLFSSSRQHPILVSLSFFALIVHCFVLCL